MNDRELSGYSMINGTDTIILLVFDKKQSVPKTLFTKQVCTQYMNKGI